MLQSENRQVKYKSDKILYPLLALWFIVNLGLHFLSNQIFGLISVILWGSTIFGVNIYRNFKENKRKDALMYIATGLLLVFIFLALTNKSK